MTLYYLVLTFSLLAGSQQAPAVAAITLPAPYEGKASCEAAAAEARTEYVLPMFAPAAAVGSICVPRKEGK